MNKNTKAKDLLLMQEELEKQRELIQYIHSGNDSVAVGKLTLIEKLDPGYYKCGRAPDGICFRRIGLKTDELIDFKNCKMDEIRKEVNKFWELKNDYNNMGFLHNRGILLYGPPGTGKSCLIKQLVEKMVEGKEIVFTTGNNLDALISGLKAFREVEPDRKLLVVMEDIDAIIRYDEHSLLELLDGDIQIDNVLYVGTTNYIDRIPDRVKRPGRFDHSVEIQYPDENGRYAYLNNKLEKFESQDKINQLVEKTKGFSFGHLREFLISVYCLKKNQNEVLNRLSNKTYSQLDKNLSYSDNQLVANIRESYIDFKIMKIVKILS